MTKPKIVQFQVVPTYDDGEMTVVGRLYVLFDDGRMAERFDDDYAWLPIDTDAAAACLAPAVDAPTPSTH